MQYLNFVVNRNSRLISIRTRRERWVWRMVEITYLRESYWIMNSHNWVSSFDCFEYDTKWNNRDRTHSDIRLVRGSDIISHSSFDTAAGVLEKHIRFNGDCELNDFNIPPSFRTLTFDCCRTLVPCSWVTWCISQPALEEKNIYWEFASAAGHVRLSMCVMKLTIWTVFWSVGKFAGIDYKKRRKKN